MADILVELVKYDMDKTKKRKRANFTVESRSEEAIIKKLEKIHKGEKVQAIHEVVWAEQSLNDDDIVETLTGVVKFFDKVKGFGFIQPDEKMDDLFFHASALESEAIEDASIVEFEKSKGPKGAIAIKINLIG